MRKIDLPEHQKVEVIVREDVPTELIVAVAEKAGSFDFLADPAEEIYAISDGELICHTACP